MIALFCALASGTAFFLGLGTADLGPLAWLAPIPILWLAFGGEPTRRVALAAAAAYMIGQAGFFWPYAHVIGPVLLPFAMVPSLVFLAVVLASRSAARHLPASVAAFVFPCLWTGWEVVEATLSPHGSFGAWAYSQVRTPVLIQSASLFGPWVIGFLIALFAAGAALSIRRRSPGTFVIVCSFVTANAVYGAWQLRQPHETMIRVAAAARDHDDHISPEQAAAAQAKEVRQLAARGARVVVFEEKTALLPGERRDTVLSPLLAAARETGVLVVSAFDQTGVQRRNAAYVISGDGRVRSYTKRHHIPGLEGGYTVGDAPGLLGDGMAVAICKDMDFQRTLRDDAAAGARLGGIGVMLVPAWDFNADAWLHARMGILRGVEGGYAVVRAASDGLVTVSDAQGRLRAEHLSGANGYVSAVADVARTGGPTLYVRIGDAFAWIAGAVGILLVLAPWSYAARRERAVHARATAVLA